MNIKLRITKSILFVFIFHLVFTGYAQKTTAEKPNILFIFADDHCYDAICALGINSEIITPADKQLTVTLPKKKHCKHAFAVKVLFKE